MSNLDHFTIPQLKTLIKHFNLKGIKISVGKSQLINQLDQHIHFDGYQIHLIDSNKDELLKPNLLKKEPRQHIKTNVKDINNKQMTGINNSIQDIISMLVPSSSSKGTAKGAKKPVMDAEGNFELIEPKPKVYKKIRVKKKPEMDDEGNFELIEPKPKKIKIKKIYKNEEDTDLFPVLPLTTKKIKVKKPTKKSQVEEFFKVEPKVYKKINIKKKDFIPPQEEEVKLEEPEDWKEIYREYLTNYKKATKDAKKLNPNFNALDAFDIDQVLIQNFIDKYGLHPGEFLHQNRLKYDKKYKKKYDQQQKYITEMENYTKDASIKNAIKQKQKR